MARAYSRQTSRGASSTYSMVVEICAWPISCCRAGRDIPACTISRPNECRNRWGLAGYGASRDVSACPAKADGPCANLDHHAVRRTRPTGRLAGIRARHREAKKVGIGTPLMKSSPTSLEQIFEAQIQALTLTLRPSTVVQYQSTVRCFLSYLRTAFPQARRPSQLHRDPHLLGWFRSLSERQPPLR